MANGKTLWHLCALELEPAAGAVAHHAPPWPDADARDQVWVWGLPIRPQRTAERESTARPQHPTTGTGPPEGRIGA
eukprot:scaffold38509_cov31-Tisochrysis_lutea.AAC.1